MSALLLLIISYVVLGSFLASGDTLRHGGVSFSFVDFGSTY